MAEEYFPDPAPISRFASAVITLRTDRFSVAHTRPGSVTSANGRRRRCHRRRRRTTAMAPGRPCARGRSHSPAPACGRVPKRCGQRGYADPLFSDRDADGGAQLPAFVGLSAMERTRTAKV
ncbi:hypothetical protein SGPA1_50458 [Streptomyces misionensis JCM 4497]